VPMACAKFLPEIETKTWLQSLLSPVHFVLDGLTGMYGRMLQVSLQRPWSVIVLVSMLFVVSLTLIQRIGKEFFPQVDSGQISLRVRAPSPFRLDATEQRVQDVERFLKDSIPTADRLMIVSEIGLNPDWSAAYTPNAGQQDALIRIQLNQERSKSSQEYAALLRQKLLKEPRFADLQVDWDTGGMVSTALNYGASAPLDIQISGGKPAETMQVARQIRDSLQDITGAVDVRIQQRDDAPYMVLNVDRQKAALLGLSAQDVIMQVVVALNSSISVQRNFWIDSQSGNQYFVGVQYPEDIDRRLDDVLNIPVSGANQPLGVNLGSLVTVERKLDAVEIHHSGLKRVTNVLVNTDNVDIGSLSKVIQDRLKKVELPAGMKVDFRGEFERMNESFASLILGLGLSALLVYLLQVTLFRSWAGPLVIMITVPLGFIGVLWMLYLSRTTFNIQSLMGVIFLVGIAVNNGVLLVDFANRQRLEGMGLLESIQLAATTRFKPILMTFLATLLALTPLALGGQRGNEANVPLARAVVGGLCSSTLLTLFLVPVLYTLLVKKLPAPVALEDDE